MKTRAIWAGVLAAGMLTSIPALADNVKLTVGGWACGAGSWATGWCDIYKQFEKEHPGVTINAVSLKSTGGPQAGGEGLIVQIASGEVPDIAIMADTTLAQFAAAGALSDITPMIQTGQIDPSAYWNAAWSAVQYKGKYWGVPFVTDTRALDYNTRLLSAAGYASPPKTLDELDAMAQKLTVTNPDGGYKQFGFWPDWGNWYIWGWGWLFGGDYYDAANQRITANDPHIVDALDYEVSYVKRYKKPAGNFCSGTLAMQIDVSSAVSGYAGSCKSLTYASAPVPAPAEGHEATWSGVWTLVIPKNAPHPKEARELLQFMTSAWAQEHFSLLNTQIPTRKQAVTDVMSEYIQRYGQPAKTYLDLTAYTHVRPIMPIANTYWSELIKAHDQAMRLAETPQAALDNVTKTLQAQLDKALSS